MEDPNNQRDDTSNEVGKISNEEGTGGETDAAPAKELPNFGLSGALAKDTQTGNTYKGVVLKWSEPEDACQPPRTMKWRLYCFKQDEHISTLHIHRQSAYLVGRNRDIVDIPTDHPSCSQQHAVIQYRQRPIRAPPSPPPPKKSRGGGNHNVERVPAAPQLVVKVYVMDLGSTNGTFLNGTRLEAARYVELREQDVLRFGNSSREYVVLHDHSAS